MTTDENIRDEKPQCDIDKEAQKISTLSSGKIYKYDYLTGAKILFSDQRKVIEKATITYSPLGRPFEKQTKMIKDQRRKRIKALKTMENNWFSLMNLSKEI